ncbi:hypothetical protein RRU94_01385 [Domibacillus sp. DTU_2020_1001157_1_SI_ALB_TIR_016]|uniref:hypothetical protein n=1 Tax=Domibacillus sp. DTU_2020_1001157_1_SI_ALB_TIR_016 TaxID=3077789 RepID=UPI0028EE0BB9|nr:hypothetical protein [Domibacillus sp. DTU_2020_1001157_1_SI_ALB_TIR_016]WNS78635.1 hypothetical protein RRU94_01385 [Domibacillus sp. DTU_2020_1001157_1_SI_ALB_TIR_016]
MLGTDDTFSYMEGIYTHRLTPDYSIEMGKRSTKPEYAVLNLPAAYSLTYQVIDLLYQHLEIDNLHVEMIGNRLVLHIKNTILRGDSEKLGASLHKAAFCTSESMKQ